MITAKKFNALRKKAMFKSALYSARIEGNPLTLEDFFIPRRSKMLNVIRENKLVNFDLIRKHFIGVNERTLRNDLKELQDWGLINKRGVTKEVYYEFKA